MHTEMHKNALMDIDRLPVKSDPSWVFLKKINGNGFHVIVPLKLVIVVMDGQNTTYGTSLQYFFQFNYSGYLHISNYIEYCYN